MFYERAAARPARGVTSPVTFEAPLIASKSIGFPAAFAAASVASVAASSSSAERVNGRCRTRCVHHGSRFA